MPRGAWRIASAVVLLAPLVTFARGVPSELLTSWDDDRFVRDFAPAREVGLESLRVIWSEPHFQAYHPLHLMSYWLDVPWAGPDGAVLGAVNLLGWALAMGLVLAVMRGLGLGPVGATLATLAFGLHPVQVEAVTWATGRKEIVAAVFAALAILAHLRTERWNDRAAWGSRALFLLAALAKTTVLPLPALLILVDVLLRRLPWRRALVQQLPSLALALGLGFAVLRIWHGAEMIRAVGGEDSPIGLVLATLSHLLGTAFLPVGLSPVYPAPSIAELGLARLLGGTLALTSALLIAWRGRVRWLAFAALGFLVLALPVLNLVPMYWVHADRYLSLPLLPLAFGLGALLERSRSSLPRHLPAVLGAGLVVALAARTVQHQRVYTHDTHLWTHATTAHPSLPIAWIKLGEVRRDAGDLEGAESAYRRAVSLAPELRLARSALFYVVALRDERGPDFALPEEWTLDFCAGDPAPWTAHLPPERRAALDAQPAWSAMRCYHRELDRVDALRVLGGELLRAGYRDAVLLVLERIFALDPPPPQQLEQVAATHLRAGRRWLARFYASRMEPPPTSPVLLELLRE